MCRHARGVPLGRRDPSGRLEVTTGLNGSRTTRSPGIAAAVDGDHIPIGLDDLGDLLIVAVPASMLGKASNGYPFVSRRDVAQRIASEPSFAAECIRALDAGSKWMASHRSRAAKLVARLATDSPSAEDLAEAAALAAPYARTLARILRERQIASGDPDLLAKAAVFGVVRSAMAIELGPPTASAPGAIGGTTTTEVPAARKRGRPKGSKNRKLPSDPEEPMKRRSRRS